ncbi:hypothetical protein L6452_36114 [Arctium lappa]|uniref:Uncharacterized protein n=1 Tax=Arctium lappa TaxID=4217 RepID=A0ACB8YCI0_ARCLA|nr:hypothetical protein L6452_36114 [Arctium lappa]
MDGTFNQTKPLDLLVGSRVCFSFDPRSATDRWPIVFLERVVSKLFDQDFSEAVSFLLSGGEFDVPWVTTPGSTVRFLSGVRDLTVDLSPYSIKALLNTFHPYGLMAVAHRYSVRDFRLLCRLGGAGYRVLARLGHRRPRRYSRLGVMGLKLLSPSYPLDFWLGKGRPLSPEAHGRLVRLLRAKLQPRELVLPPDELFETEESRDFLEYSLLYGWMRQWLNYLKWYHLTALSPWVTLEELFSDPVVSHSWRMVAMWKFDSHSCSHLRSEALVNWGTIEPMYLGQVADRAIDDDEPMSFDFPDSKGYPGCLPNSVKKRILQSISVVRRP